MNSAVSSETSAFSPQPAAETDMDYIHTFSMHELAIEEIRILRLLQQQEYIANPIQMKKSYTERYKDARETVIRTPLPADFDVETELNNFYCDPAELEGAAKD